MLLHPKGTASALVGYCQISKPIEVVEDIMGWLGVARVSGPATVNNFFARP